MTSRISTPLRVAAVAASTAVLGAMTAFPAAGAENDDVQVVNTETVQVYTSPAGEVESRRVYEQVSMTGTGTVDLSNPISVEGLRNLDGFGGFDVDGGNQVAEVEVDGEKRLRSAVTSTASCHWTSPSSTASTVSGSSPATSSARTASSRSCST